MDDSMLCEAPTMRSVLLCLTGVFIVCEAHKILVMSPFPGKSNVLLGNGIVRHLLNDGHEVTYITPLKYEPTSPNLRIVDVSGNTKLLPEGMLDIEEIMKKEVNLQDQGHMINLMIEMIKFTIQNDNVQKLINDQNENFDAAVIEWMFTELPSGYFDRMEKQVYDNLLAPIIARRGRQVPNFDDVKFNASLVLANSHVSVGQSVALPQNYIPIAGYHIEENVKPLPEDLKKILDSSKDGVIYFSLGSNLKSKDIPTELKLNLVKMFSGLKQTVLWKFEDDLPNKPKNVHILKWAPQQSILSHPNTVLFITHGGLLSTTETIHFGVPTVGIPIFADQFINVNRAVKRGFALRVDISYTMADELKSAIEEITTNPRYSEKAKELSFIYHNRPVTPGKELIHWVKHVIETRGAPHLRSPALHVPFYQKLYLDLLLVILVNAFVIMRIFKSCISLVCSKKNNNGVKKTN